MGMVTEERKPMITNSKGLLRMRRKKMTAKLS
jgi:hypothetical protein